MLNAFMPHNVTRKGMSLHTRVCGEGPPLLLQPPPPESLIENDLARYVRSAWAFAMRVWRRSIPPHWLGTSAARPCRAPLRVLRSEHGTVARCFDVLAPWREGALRVSGQSLPCGHCIAEEAPDRLIPEALSFTHPDPKEQP